MCHVTVSHKFDVTKTLRPISAVEVFPTYDLESRVNSEHIPVLPRGKSDSISSRLQLSNLKV